MPKKILLADDSITIQKVVELTFSDGDYEVVATNNGAKALQKLAEIHPDIILSDIIMPEKNGYEVCEFVKSHPEFRHIPVILLTGTFEPFDPDRAEKAGCDAVVTKPFESQSLIHKVEELIQQASSPANLEDETPFATTAIMTPPAPSQQEASAFEDAEETRAWPVESFAAPEPPQPAASAETRPFEQQTSAPFAEFPPAEAQQPSFEDRAAEPEAEEHGSDIFSAPPPAESPMPMPFESEELLPEGEYGGDVRSFPMMDMRATEHAAEESPESESMEREAEEPLLGAEPPVPHAADLAGLESSSMPFSSDETIRVVPPWNPQDGSYQEAAGEPFSTPEAEEESPFAPEESAPAAPEPVPFQEALTSERPWSPAESPQTSPSWEGQPPAGAGGSFSEPLESSPATAEPEEPFEPAAEAPIEEEHHPELPPPMPVPAPAAEVAAVPGSLTDEQVERIAKRVVELMSERIVRDIAWEVIPDLAESVVRDRIRQLENEN